MSSQYMKFGFCPVSCSSAAARVSLQKCLINRALAHLENMKICLSLQRAKLLNDGSFKVKVKCTNVKGAIVEEIASHKLSHKIMTHQISVKIAIKNACSLFSHFH